MKTSENAQAVGGHGEPNTPPKNALTSGCLRFNATSAGWFRIVEIRSIMNGTHSLANSKLLTEKPSNKLFPDYSFFPVSFS